MVVRDGLTIYENESNTSPLRQRTLSKHHSKLRNVLSLERKVFLDSLMVVLTVVEANHFPLEIPNPNTFLFWKVLLKDAKLLYLVPYYKGTIFLTRTLGSVPILCSY